MRGVVELGEALAVEQQVDELVAGAMPALDDDRRRAHAVDAPRRLACVGRACGSCMPAEHLRFGDVRRHDAARAAAARPAGSRTPSSSSRRSPLLATITGSTTTQRQVELVDGGRHRLDDRGVGQHAGLRGVHVDVAGDGLDLRGDEVGRHGVERPTTPTVFCAVTAVMALVP